jgi:hypothetical protein
VALKLTTPTHSVLGASMGRGRPHWHGERNMPAGDTQPGVYLGLERNG